MLKMRDTGIFFPSSPHGFHRFRDLLSEQKNYRIWKHAAMALKLGMGMGSCYIELYTQSTISDDLY
jgi:hypothetical protein